MSEKFWYRLGVVAAITFSIATVGGLFLIASMAGII